MRPIFHRHYRPLNPFKSPLISLSLSPKLKPPKPKPFSLSLSQKKNSLSRSLSETLKARSDRTDPKPTMAQKTGKEETEFKVHEKIPLCINNCGFTGNPATNNMCQNCFNTSNSPTTATTTTTNTNASSTTTNSSSTTTSTMTGTTTVSSSSANKLLKVHHRSSASSFRSGTTTEVSSEDVVAAAAADRVRSEGFSFGFGSEVKREVNRCFGCRRKVGLTGFRCRCGELFCAEHRYTDRHVCSYDYKAAGSEAIARENPVVKAAKIVRV